MLTIKEAAALLRCSDKHIRDLIHLDKKDPDKLPAYKVGRSIVLDEQEIKEYMRERCAL